MDADLLAKVLLYLLALRGLFAVIGLPPVMEWFRRRER